MCYAVNVLVMFSDGLPLDVMNTMKMVSKIQMIQKVHFTSSGPMTSDKLFDMSGKLTAYSLACWTVERSRVKILVRNQDTNLFGVSAPLTTRVNSAINGAITSALPYIHVLMIRRKKGQAKYPNMPRLNGPIELADIS